jgi:Fe-S-cluster containining protein
VRTEPFQFGCTACGRCCTWGGWVCLYPKDARAIASYLDITLQEFADTYTHHIAVEYKSKESTVVVPYLALKTNGNTCIFLEDKLCKVHEAKPYQCAASPLCAEFLIEDSGWQLFLTECEGIGKGEVITRPMIDKALKEQARNDMDYERDLAKNKWRLESVLGILLPEPELIPDLGFEVDID